MLMSKNDCEMNLSMAPDLEPWIGSSTAPINFNIIYSYIDLFQLFRFRDYID